MKKPPAKSDTSNSDSSQTDAQKRMLMLGATFIALGTAVGLDIDNAFAGPSATQNKITVNSDTVTNKAKTADKHFQAMDAYVRGRQVLPDSRQNKSDAQQLKQEMQQNLNNIPTVVDSIEKSTPPEEAK